MIHHWRRLVLFCQLLGEVGYDGRRVGPVLAWRIVAAHTVRR